MKTKGIEINFRPSLKQQIAWEYLMDKTTNFIGYGGAAYGGKTNLECYWLTIMCIAYKGTAWGLGRKELSVLKKTALISLFEVFQECNIKPDRDYKFNGQENKIVFTNGSVIFLIDTAFQPSDPLYTRFGGLELTGCAVDESAETGELAIDILFTRCGRKKNDVYDLPAKFLETFNPSKTHVYRRYYKPWKEGKLPDHYKFVQAFPQDNPHPSAKTYVETILKNGSKQTIARLIHGNFEYEDDPAALILYDKMVDVFSNKHVPGGRKCMTNDLARLGGDRIVSIEWDGHRGYVTAAKKQTLDITGKEIESKRLKMGIGKSDVLCDEDGLGGGVVDYEKFKGFVNNAAPLPNPENPLEKENYDNLKSQCSFRMADRINRNEVYLVCAEKWMEGMIIEEMEQVKQKALDTDQKKGVIPKQIMKEVLGRSPDFWDTIMMREWFDLKPRFVPTADEV